MGYELKGKLIEKFDTVVISEKFRKREFVIEQKETTKNGFEYTETIKLQFTQDNCDRLDKISIGDDVNVGFNIRGKRWEKNGDVNYFNNLDAWKIEVISEGTSEGTTTETSENKQEDLPF